MMKKKLLTSILVCSMLFAIGCFRSNTLEDSKDTSTVKSEESTPKTKESPKENIDGTYNLSNNDTKESYEVTIKALPNGDITANYFMEDDHHSDTQDHNAESGTYGNGILTKTGDDSWSGTIANLALSTEWTVDANIKSNSLYFNISKEREFEISGEEKKITLENPNFNLNLVLTKDSNQDVLPEKDKN